MRFSTRPITFCLLLLLGYAAWAAAPANYYSAVDVSSAANARATIHATIDDHQRYPYTSGSTDTWDILEEAQEDPNNAANIIDVYKNASYVKLGGGVGVYNREHTWPKSYGFPDDTSDNYPYTDCHHLMLCDDGYNTSRSNKPYDFAGASDTEKPTDSNNGEGGGSGTYPGNSNWTFGSFTDGGWEAWIGKRGDVARAMFYMAIRYEGGTHGGTGYAEPNLELTNNRTLIENSNTGSNTTGTAYMGLLDVLIQWHIQDPPTTQELIRNDVVYSYQNNRNPFVDHPEWVSKIWDCTPYLGVDATAPARPIGLGATPSGDDVYLDWDDNAGDGAVGYLVYRGQVSGGPHTLVTGSVLPESHFTDLNLPAGTFYYVVTAVDMSANESAASDEVDSTGADTSAPAKPTGLNASASETSVSLDWADNGEPDLAAYNVYRSTTQGKAFALIAASVGSSAYVDTAVSAGATYYYGVTAVDSSGNESDFSGQAAATVPKNDPPASPGCATTAKSAGGPVPAEMFIAPVVLLLAGLFRRSRTRA